MRLEKKLIQMVEEDQGLKDITTDFTPNVRVRAEIISNEECTVAGISILKTLFKIFNIKVINSADEGDMIKKGERVFILDGSSHDILLVERTALNILSRMSGIASLTKEYVKMAKNVKIAATRKTTPLFGYFEKEAVRIGGGDTHRFGLYDCVLIKDNHLKLFKDVSDAIRKARENTSFTHKIEIEVNNTRDAIESAKSDVDIILLDNMNPSEIMETISKLSENGLRDKVIIEASGNINLNNIDEYIKTGVDIISIGRLTHSAPAKDFSLRIL